MRAAVEKICARFTDVYWRKRDSDGEFPQDFYRALADAGWLGVCIPEIYGGSGLGVSEAAIMMQTITASGAGLSGASAVHMNIFGLNPVVVFGSEAQKRRMLPPQGHRRERKLPGSFRDSAAIPSPARLFEGWGALRIVAAAALAVGRPAFCGPTASSCRSRSRSKTDAGSSAPSAS